MTGALKALDYGLGPVPAALMGMVTGIGGGMARDLLAGRVPVVFSSELYATPALLGATWAVLADGWGLPVVLVAIPGVVICFGLRVLALRRNWHAPLPRAGRPASERCGAVLEPSGAEDPVEVGVGEDPVGVEPLAQGLDVGPPRVGRREVGRGAGVQLAPVGAAVVAAQQLLDARGSSRCGRSAAFMWKAR